VKKLIHNRRKKIEKTKDGRILVLSKLEKLTISNLNIQENLHKSRIKLINKIFNEESFELEKKKITDVIKFVDKKNNLLVAEINKLGDKKFYKIEKRYYKWKKNLLDYLSSSNPEALEIIFHAKNDKKGGNCLAILREIQKKLVELNSVIELIEMQQNFIENLFLKEGYPIDQALYDHRDNPTTLKADFPTHWSISLKGCSKFFNKTTFYNDFDAYENADITKEHFELVDYELFNIDRTFYSNKSSFAKKFRELYSNTSFNIRNTIDPDYIKFIKKNFITETEKYLRKIELLKRTKIKGEKKISNTGYVYVLSNKAYPNIYKIGSTYGLPEERAEELTGTGHLTPFKVVGKIKIQSAEYYEKSIHKLLKDYRIKKGREFFKLDLSKIKDCLKQVSEISEQGTKKITLAKIQKEIDLNK